MSLWHRLDARTREAGEISVAVVGAGYVGAGIVSLLEVTPGFRVAALVNRTIDRAIDAFVEAGRSLEELAVTDDAAVATAAIDEQRPVVTTRPETILGSSIDIVVEATGALTHGAAVILDALDAGHHVVSYNAEIDALLGGLFHQRARERGRVYTIADGDQPGVLLRHRQHVEGMGFEVTAALNCKRHLDVHQTPSSGAAYASRDSTSDIMTTAFGDGTKMQVEMAVVANATGLVPVKRGMVGIRSTVETAAVDIPAALGADGCVDYTLGGDFNAGVGIVGRHVTGTQVEKPMRFYKMGEGPYYFFFRPYHLVHLELPVTLAEVALDGVALATVDGPHVAEVVAMAKRDLAAGEALDCIGGFTVYGLVDRAEHARDLLPVGLAEKAVVTRPVGIDEPIALDDVDLDVEDPLVARWLAQRDLNAAT